MDFAFFTLFGFFFIFFTTVLGAAFVYCIKEELSPKLYALIFGFSAGIMTAASVWSLLLPALEGAKESLNKYAFLPVSSAFLLGGALIVLFERLTKQNEGCSMELLRAKKLFLSMTLHNIPEGLAVGFAFGVASLTGTRLAYMAALGLALGIGFQNLPEGAAVSLPMKTALNSKNKAFFYGVCSAVVEPIFAVIGYLFIGYLQPLQPWLLAFSAGAMIFVVADELLPQTKTEQSGFGAWGFMIGFVCMMILDLLG